MSNGVDLLRLLEPAVRPGGLAGGKALPTQPIESRSFESLLEEAKAAGLPQQAVNEPNRASAVDPLKPLARVDLIDNAALLRMIGGERAATAQFDV